MPPPPKTHIQQRQKTSHHNFENRNQGWINIEQREIKCDIYLPQRARITMECFTDNFQLSKALKKTWNVHQRYLNKLETIIKRFRKIRLKEPHATIGSQLANENNNPTCPIFEPLNKIALSSMLLENSSNNENDFPDSVFGNPSQRLSLD